MYFTANGWQEDIKAQKAALYSWRQKKGARQNSNRIAEV